MSRRALIASLALILADVASAQASPGPRCLAHPERVGPCRTVHGRLQVGNGTPSTRIWVVGTRRLLGVREHYYRSGGEIVPLPANVRRALRPAPFLTQVFADFEVCPLTRQRPGWMQSVCVARATRLYARRR